MRFPCCYGATLPASQNPVKTETNVTNCTLQETVRVYPESFVTSSNSVEATCHSNQMRKWPQPMTMYRCRAFFGPQAHEGSLDMSVGLQSRSRGSPCFQCLMEGRRAAGIAMDYGEVMSHSFHVASDKVRVGSKSKDDAKYIWESGARGSVTARRFLLRRILCR